MAWLITRKHAIGLGRVWYHQYLHLITLLLQPGALLHLPNTADIERMENQILHMASSYEWVVHPLLDNLYIQALNYFYCKGIIDGLFGKSCLAKVLRGILAQKILFPFKDNVTGLNGLSTDFAKYF